MKIDFILFSHVFLRISFKKKNRVICVRTTIPHFWKGKKVIYLFLQLKIKKTRNFDAEMNRFSVD